jgi:hypothetical protein
MNIMVSHKIYNWKVKTHGKKKKHLILEFWTTKYNRYRPICHKNIVDYGLSNDQTYYFRMKHGNVFIAPIQEKYKSIDPQCPEQSPDEIKQIIKKTSCKKISMTHFQNMEIKTETETETDTDLSKCLDFMNHLFMHTDTKLMSINEIFETVVSSPEYQKLIQDNQ